MKARVLLIGAGRRIQNNFLPALRCLSDQFEIVGIHSRTPARLREVAETWSIKAVERLSRDMLRAANLIVLSISTENVPCVLGALAATAPEQQLLIDTPVLASIRDFGAVRLLKRYQRVLVAEDYVNFPEFELLRRVLDTGWVGKLHYVALDHCGYNYHGFALARSLFGFRYPKLIRHHKLGRFRSYSLSFARDRIALVTEPYDPANGRLMVAGSAGIIANYQVQGDDVSRLVILEEKGFFGGVRVHGSSGEETFVPRHLNHLRNLKLRDVSIFNTQKTLGLIRIFESYFEKNINSGYGFREALYDHYAVKLAYRLPLLWDPIAFVGGNSLQMLMPLARFLPAPYSGDVP